MRMGWVRAAVAVIPLTLILLISVPPDFILGRGPYWDYLISDRAQAVTGYLYFVQNSWAQPLLFIPNLSIPQGDYLINADSIVLLALIGRVIHSLLGATMIPYGVWYVLCGVLNGVAGVVILRRTGVADFGRLAAAAVIVGSTPFWLERWYHFSLIAQFLILLSVHAYLIARARPWVGLAYGLVLAVLAGLIHIYLFCMIMLILAGIIVEVGLRRDGWRLSRILSGVAALMLAAVSVYAQGYFSLSGSTENQGYMEFSTNLLSPFYSTHSGFSAASWSLLAEMREKADAWPFFLGQRPDATGGQYLEGMSYLGLGVWLLVAVAIVRTGPREILALARRHYVLIAAAVVALAFAVTPLVTFGSAHLQVFDPGSKLVSVLSSLRASGRFFWVTGYIAIAAALVLVCRRLSPRAGVLVLCLAAVVQLVDTLPIRLAIAFDASRGSEILGGQYWKARLTEASELQIIPSSECGDPDKTNFKSFIQELAAKAGPLPTNSSSQSRTLKDCQLDFTTLKPGAEHPGALYVFLDGDDRTAAIDDFIARHAAECERFLVGTDCLIHSQASEAGQ